MKYLISDSQACSTWKKRQNKSVNERYLMQDDHWKWTTRGPGIFTSFECNFVQCLNDELLDTWPMRMNKNDWWWRLKTFLQTSHHWNNQEIYRPRKVKLLLDVKIIRFISCSTDLLFIGLAHNYRTVDADGLRSKKNVTCRKVKQFFRTRSSPFVRGWFIRNSKERHYFRFVEYTKQISDFKVILKWYVTFDKKIVTAGCVRMKEEECANCKSMKLHCPWAVKRQSLSDLNGAIIYIYNPNLSTLEKPVHLKDSLESNWFLFHNLPSCEL